MNPKPFWPLLLVAALVGTPAAAQEEPEESGATREGAPSILQAIKLPDLAEVLRSRGVPTEEIEAAIESARRRGVPPEEMTGVLEETAETVEANGPIEGFGAFVQEQLAAGLRGRDLADAIRTEHARRGIGQGRMLESRGRGQGSQGQPGAGRGQGSRGQPGAERGQGGQSGPPGRAGRSRVGSDSMTPDSMADTAGRRGPPPIERGQRGRRPDTMPARPDTSGSGGDQENGGQR